MKAIAKHAVEFQRQLEEKKSTVDGYLAEFLPKEDAYPASIHQAMRYSVFAGGKRLRPILALATGEALDGDFSRMIYLACALEMVHAYSLIHDDLPAMDDDDLRRGVPTCHKKFGEGIAILAGNGLLTLAFQLLAEIPGGKRTADLKVRVIHQLCRALGTRHGVIGGQAVDLTTQGKPFTREQLEYIHTCKTSALIEASVSCAAMLSDAEEDSRRSLASYGSSIGLAFQIIDDILDVEGTPEELGKKSGKDTTARKATYPSLYGVQKSRAIVEELIESAVQKISFLGMEGQFLRDLAYYIAARRS